MLRSSAADEKKNKFRFEFLLAFLRCFIKKKHFEENTEKISTSE
jgi:hypothetical protein